MCLIQDESAQKKKKKKHSRVLSSRNMNFPLIFTKLFLEPKFSEFAHFQPIDDADFSRLGGISLFVCVEAFIIYSLYSFSSLHVFKTCLFYPLVLYIRKLNSRSFLIFFCCLPWTSVSVKREKIAL